VLAALVILLTLPICAAAAALPLTPARSLDFDVEEGTWISLAVSPDGGTILFELLGDLYVMPVGGGPASAITHGMAFNSQPVFSPDGARIAFVSDRSGAENVWTAGRDGSDATQITHNAGPDEFVSPVWSADGKAVFVSLYRSDRNAAELWRYSVTGADPGQEYTKGAFSALGAAPSPDGRYLYYAAHTGPLFEDDVTLPMWSIRRRELASGRDEAVVTNQGSAMRPVLSPEGHRLVYGARVEGRTELRVRDLESGADTLLILPVQRDVQEALPTRDLLPGYAFTPDGSALLVSFGGKIQRVDMATGRAAIVPFSAHIARPIGPSLRLAIGQDSGPVRSRLIQDPALSPDGAQATFSALGRIYVMDLKSGVSHSLAPAGAPQFMPSWSPDGRSILYVTWTAAEGGRIWRASAGGETPPQPLTPAGPFYTDPVLAPDGHEVLALRSSNYERMHAYMEPVFTGRAFGALRQADLVAIPASRGAARIIASGLMSGPPQVADKPGQVYLLFDDGLNAVALDGSGRKAVLQVVGPGYYFLEKPEPADDMRISPDGKWVLVQHVQQLHLIAMPPDGAPAPTIDLSAPSLAHRRLTSVGADFFGWADHGRAVAWTLGSHIYRRPLSAITLDPPGAARAGDRPVAGQGGVEAFDADIEVPRDTPHGALILRGGTAITMRGDEVIENADIVVKDNRIVAVGRRGQTPAPAGALIRDITGLFVMPGLIDVHDHWACVRRGVLDMSNWCFLATLAYGVTSGLDPSTLTIDMLAYQDLIDAGLALGPRVYSTGVAVFSFNRFASEEETYGVLSRYRRDYHLQNLKEYRTGDREVREWVAMAAKDLELMPTTEGALDMKLDLTQVIDGFAGNEHSLSAAPLYGDVVQLFARTRDSYTLTLQISHGGPPAMNDFIARETPLNDPKISRFYPPYMREKLFSRVPWVDSSEAFYPAVAEGAAKVQRAGGLVGVGSHGNIPGLGYHWELQAYAAGGMTPREVLHAATIGSAETIGRQNDVGSLEPGKFADLIILTRNPLANVANTLSLSQVMKNGRLYDADTLDEIWPLRAALAPPWFHDEDPTVTPRAH
jgi:Tol biopolymer transport system component